MPGGPAKILFVVPVLAVEAPGLVAGRHAVLWAQQGLCVGPGQGGHGSLHAPQQRQAVLWRVPPHLGGDLKRLEA